MAKAVCAVVNGETMTPIAGPVLPGCLGARKTTRRGQIRTEQQGGDR
ncbi:GTP-binding protein, partial [Salmonella enterica subsp. enterica serovar Wilhelmsburg]